ncbi:MAG: hypothetical protein A2W98_00580 [Bacteroidetes bacterium GWF2_33_38]|nr:MAG: hypothetical protein A2W98_00580 [Bacteroidetes bacterium GWF2_33_38]
MLIFVNTLSFSQLIISQYIETSSGSNPKGIELWNNSGATIDFSVTELVVMKGSAGGAATTTDFTLNTGTLANGAVMVIGTAPDVLGTGTGFQDFVTANGSAFYVKAFTFNGDDALEIYLGGVMQDILGDVIGVDPAGTGWAGNGVQTYNQNITLLSGITTGASTGWTDPSLRFEVTTTDNSLTGFGIAPVTASTETADWNNLQWPNTGTILTEETFDVYAQVYEAGVTEAAGQGADIEAWIGYSTDNTDPSTWTNWIAATYYTDAGNNDEYKANIGAVLSSAGTYYYASRFSVDNGPYTYGGYVGGTWDGITNVSGVLTVNARCADPSDLTIVGTTTTSAQITWTENSTANVWSVKHGTTGFDPATEGTLHMGATVRPYTIWALTPGTDYEFYVEATCTTSWVGPKSFRTINTATDITDFSFAEQTGLAVFSNDTIYIEVTGGTDLTNLVATYTLAYGATADILGTLQVSGSTINNFSSYVTYTITAEDGTSTQDWIIATSVEGVLSSEANILAYSFTEQMSPAVFSNDTIYITVNSGTDLTNLVASFTLSVGATAEVSLNPQVSGVTVNNFSSFVIYTITAENGTTTQDWVIAVSEFVIPYLIINEVDIDQTSTDTNEFIELFDGGTGNTSLDGFVIVLYNGSGDVSYNAIDLDGYNTDNNGYFVIGSATVSNVDLVSFTSSNLQNGPDAVALYYDDATSFPTSTPVTAINLIDAIVYGTSDAPNLTAVLLNSGELFVNENMNGKSTTESMQRIPNGTGGERNTSTYLAVYPTPGTENLFPEVDWCNLQWPENGAIASGTSFNVYAQVYEPGITDAVGAGTGIEAWIGYNSTNISPDTWTNWIPATFNKDTTNNDEFMSEIGSTLTVGTYYYASRFKVNGGTYKYGGFNLGGGGFWDGFANVNGVLTVLNNETAVLDFSFAEQTGSATFSNDTIYIEVDAGTNLSNLVASFTLSNGATASILGINQESGVTTNDFINFVTYTILAEDGIATQNWVVSVSEYVYPLGTDCTNPFMAMAGTNTTDNSAGGQWFAYTAPDNGVINISSCCCTAVDTRLFVYLDNCSNLIIDEDDTDGCPANTEDVNFLINAGETIYILWNDDYTTATYNWELSYNLLNTEANILSFNFPEATSVAVIDSINAKVNIEVDYQTNFTNLVANYTLSNGAIAEVLGVEQESGVTSNDFSSSVIYKVIAQDTTYQRDWTVNVSERVPSSEAEILWFSFPEALNPATFDFINHTINIEVGMGTSLTALTAYFNLSNGATAEIAGIPQTSGTTQNDFSVPVTYIITAEDGIAFNEWLVTVTVATSLNDQADILWFNLNEATGTAVMDNMNHEISIEVTWDTDLSNLVADFNLSYGATASILGISQESGVTVNNFSSPITYTVVSEDGMVTNDWEVTVYNAPIPAGIVCESAVEAYQGMNYASHANATDEWFFFVAQESGYLTLNTCGLAIFDTYVITYSDCGTYLSESDDDCGGTYQSNLTVPMVAGDTIWIEWDYDTYNPDGYNWELTYYVPNTENDIISFSFAEQTSPAVIDYNNNTIAVEVVYGTDVTNLIASFDLSNYASANIGGVPQNSSTTINDFTNTVIYTVVAENGDIQDWSVNVSVRPLTNDLMVIFPEGGNNTMCDLTTMNVPLGIFNNGDFSVPMGDSIFVYYNVNAEPNVEDTIVLAADFAVGDTMFFQFPDAYDFSALGFYDYAIGFEYENDTIATNNVTIGQINHIVLTVSINEGDSIQIHASSFPYTLTLSDNYNDYHWYNSNMTMNGNNNQFEIYDFGWYYIEVDNGDGCNAIDSIFVESTPPFVDLAISQPSHGEYYQACELTDNQSIDFRIRNVGEVSINAGETIECSYFITGNSLVSEQFILPTNLNPGDEISYLFTQTADLSAIGVYAWTFGISYVNDMDENNNHVQGATEHVQYTVEIEQGDTIYAYGFELPIRLNTTEWNDNYLWYDETLASVTTSEYYANSFGWHYVEVSSNNMFGCTAIDSVLIIERSQVNLDVALVGDIPSGMFSFSTCPDLVEDLSYMIANAGLTTIPAGDTIYFESQLDIEPMLFDTLILSSDLLSGETYEYQTQHVLDITALGSHTFTLNVIFEGDLDLSNNTAIINLEVVNAPTVEIANVVGDTLEVYAYQYPIELSLTNVFDWYNWNGNSGNGNETSYEVSSEGWVYVRAGLNNIDCNSQDSIFISTISPISLDLAIFQPQSNDYVGCDLGVDSMEFTFINAGINTIPSGTLISLGYQIDSNLEVIENVTLTEDLTSGSTYDYQFSQPFDFSAIAIYDWKFFVNVAGDLNFANDTTMGTYEHTTIDVQIDAPDTIYADLTDFPIHLSSLNIHDQYTWFANGNQVSNAAEMDVYAYGVYHLYAQFDNSNCSGMDSVYIMPTPQLSYDIGYDSESYSLFECGLSTHQIPFPIINYGEEDIQIGDTIYISIQLDGGAVVNEEFVLDTIFPSNSYIFYETQNMFDLSAALHTYHFDIEMNMTNDENLSNNIFSIEITNAIYDLDLDAINGGSNDTLTVSSFPVTLDAGAGYESYLWSTVETTQTIEVSVNGWYYAEIYNDGNCYSEDSIYVNLFVGINELIAKSAIGLYPNPNNGNFVLNIKNAKTSDIRIEMLDFIGKVISVKEISNVDTHIEEFDVNILPKGIYFVKVSNSSDVMIERVIIQ